MALSVLTLALSQQYTNDSINGVDGVLKGSPCTIKSIQKENGINKVIFEWFTPEGESRTSEMHVQDGVNIKSFIVNDKNEIILTLNDGTVINGGAINTGSVPVIDKTTENAVSIGVLSISTTTKNRLSNIPKNSGQLIFVTDTRELFFDFNSTDRIPYQQLIILDTDEQRLNIIPMAGLYYIKDTQTLWSRQDGKWINLFENFINADIQQSKCVEYIDGSVFNIEDPKEKVIYFDIQNRMWFYRNNQWNEFGVLQWGTF